MVLVLLTLDMIILAASCYMIYACNRLRHQHMERNSLMSETYQHMVSIVNMIAINEDGVITFETVPDDGDEDWQVIEWESDDSDEETS